MTPLALVPDEPKKFSDDPTLDVRVRKLYALLESKEESDIEALGNTLATLQAWFLLSDAERAGTPGFEYIMACTERLAGVRQHLIDKESQ